MRPKLAEIPPHTAAATAGGTALLVPSPAGTVVELDDVRGGRAGRRRRWLVRRALLTADLAALALATLAALGVPDARDGVAVALAAPLVLALFAANGAYRRDETRTDHTTVDDLPRLAGGVTAGVWVILVAATVLHARIDTAELVVFWAVALAGVTLLRGGARTLARRTRLYIQNTVIVGAGHVGCLVAEKIANHPEYGLRLLGFVDADPLNGLAEQRTVPVLGDVGDLRRVVRRLGIERVIVAFSRDDEEALAAVLRTIRTLDVQVQIVPRLFEAVGPAVAVDAIEGLPLVELPALRPSTSALIAKRAFDIVSASAGLVLLAPTFLVIAAVLRVGGGPIFYRGQRIGRGGRRIPVTKFRTMRPDAERLFSELMSDERIRAEFERSHKLADDPRVTRLGAFLRKSSLDELPQLLDVLAGRLSIVGPRPMTAMEWDLRYGSLEPGEPMPDLGYWSVDDLRPGLTGYWQINGRSKITFPERLRLDMAYLSNWSLKLDVIILAKTLRALLAGDRGAY